MTTLDAHPLTDQATVVHAPGALDGEWWRHAVIYQVYPRSFADGSGDGIGDLPGITSRLEHLAELGVDAVWLSPFYRSPQADAGYDVADYRDVDPLFGTLADFDALLARAHGLGLRVIVDLVPNHTSDEHAWFVEALADGPGSAARERYLFREGRGENGEQPPNNWQSIFGGPAWTRVPDGQWYLHLFDSRQPDLDWEHPQVRAEFEDVLRFWLDRGVDGFRIDVAHGMVKAEGLPDWDGHVSMIEGSEAAFEAAEHALHDHAPSAGGRVDEVTGSGNQGPMFDQEGVHEIYRAWHRVLAEYDGDRALVAEAWVEPLSRLARYVRPDEMHQAFNFAFLATLWHAPSLRDVITASYTASDSVGAPTTWVLSNHDVVRHASRLGLATPGSRPNGIGADDEQPDEELGLRRARCASLLMLGLPGSAYLYQGEELGLPDHTTLPDDVRQDPAFFRTLGAELGRDGCRVPLPWAAAEPGFGFSPTGETWLPQPQSFARYAADVQRGVPGSTYETYRTALRVRRAESLGSGGLTWLPSGADVLDFVNRDVRVVANLGDGPVVLAAGTRVLLASGPLATDDAGALLVGADTTVWVRP
ncbi:alpha-amylase [Cellulomonas sp. A375-1]|uniref:Alpha-glucosidase n=1 Tax=Cellulomonas gelida TaxID=1712 RepID=A0A4Y3KIL2_9CELL|nr:alpha-amylase [Cellulomonas sp. A375-1]GEA83837.1 alpha-glucosidase [Cellulomonas gelida]GGL25665.1 alpha-glucosidase [Cellulomonas gelida]